MKAYNKFLFAGSFFPVMAFALVYQALYIPSPYKTLSGSVLGTTPLTSPARPSPVRLKIGVINVNANIQQVGIAPNGEMGVPNNYSDVGWFKLGTIPGEKGSAVIAGHLNGENGDPGVFSNLHKLKRGDLLSVEDSNGNATVYVVRETRVYSAGYADDVFGSGGKAQLNLVTCDGTWDVTKKSYLNRLVVFTDFMY